MSEPPSEIVASAGMVQLPTQGDLERIYTEAAHLAELEQLVGERERELESLRDDVRRLKTKTIPRLFNSLHTDKLGIPGWNADVVLKTKYHAAVRVDAPDDEREAAFDEIERLGGEEMIRTDIIVTFSRGEFELAAEFLQFIRGWNRLGGRGVRVRKNINWQTLTKWVEDMVSRNAPIKLDKLGATCVHYAQVVFRKERKKSYE